MNTEHTQKLVVEWFGEEVLRRPTKRRRRTKKEILESHRVKCSKCGHSWIHLHSE